MLNQRSMIVAGAVSLAALAPMAAKAADMPTYAPPPMVEVAPAFSWDGFYVGLFAGYGWGDVDTTELFNTPFLIYYNGTGAPYSLDNNDGFFGGAQIGYNWQWDWLVLGVEGEIGYLDLGGSRVDPNSLAFAAGDTVSKFDSDFYASLTAKAGIAANNFLIYAKGGVAWLSGDGSTVDACNVFPCGGGLINATGGETMTGWTLGAGVEYAFSNNWSVKAEYMYMDFGDFNVGGVSNGGLYFNQTMDVTANTLKVGVNYRF
jgi:outer membrane immunogenic protein